MNNDLISVVVPCYNVEKYLEKCVNSIINQTYKNLEIILVDDGATDETPNICDKLAKTDTRIKVIHKENGGISDARNTGLSVAQGKYITFFDSDDWVESDTLNIAYREITEKNLDLVIWGYVADFVDDNEKIISSRNTTLNGVCEKNGDASVLLSQKALGISGYVWNKLYKVDIIKNNELYFEKNVSLFEDILFNALYFCECQKILFLDYIGTHYIQRNRITLGTKRYDDIFELKLLACIAREDILKNFNIDAKSIEKTMAPFYFNAIKSGVFNISTEQGISFINKTIKMRKFLKSEKTREVLQKIVEMPLKQKIFMLAVRMRMATLLIFFCK